jgi:BlaI family penicillinase repressor
MNQPNKIPDGELEVMMAVWQAGESATSDTIMEYLAGRKKWGRTTVLKFLSRLCDRGYLKQEKHGKLNVYFPLVKQQDYLEMESKSFLERLCQNSVKKLVASLYDGKAISKEDLEELKKFIEEAE